MRAMEKPLIALLLLGLAWGTVRAAEDPPVVYTNKDLPKAEGTSRPPAESKDPDPVELPTYDAIRDRNGHGEAWWRQRACELDAQIAVAEDEAQRLLVRSKRNGVLVDPTVATRAKEAADHLIELRAERAGLPKELTEAGGLSSWLYGISCLEAPALAAPETTPADVAEGLAMSWKSVTPGARYVVELQCLDCCGMAGPCDVRSVEAIGTSLRLPFDAGHSGRWRVRAIDPTGPVGAWSEWQSFSRP